MHLCITRSVTRWVGADTVNRHMNKNSPLYCIFSSYILVNKLAPYCPQIVVFYDWSTSVNIGHSINHYEALCYINLTIAQTLTWRTCRVISLPEEIILITWRGWTLWQKKYNSLCLRKGNRNLFFSYLKIPTNIISVTKKGVNDQYI